MISDSSELVPAVEVAVCNLNHNKIRELPVDAPPAVVAAGLVDIQRTCVLHGDSRHGSRTTIAPSYEVGLARLEIYGLRPLRQTE